MNRPSRKKLNLSFLGHPLIELDGTPAEPKLRKALALLAYLAVTAERHTRDELAELLYPRLNRDRSRSDIRQIVLCLRGCIGEHLGADRDDLWLAFEDLRVDVLGFRRLLAEAGTRERSGDGQSTRHLLVEAVGLTRGAFLSGLYLRDSPEFERWQEMQREELGRMHAAALLRLAAIDAKRGNLPAAVEWTRRRLNLDPLEEPAHRDLMRLLARSGDRAGALRQYERCRDLLRADLGQAPDPETEELGRQIADGRFGPATASPPARGAHVPAGIAPSLLPTPPTSFVGRQTETSTVVESLRETRTRLLTLTGPGGVGKTRLAVEAAARLKKQFSGRIAFVDLAPLADPGQVPAAIAAAIGVREMADGSRPLLEALKDSLDHQRVLLLLDNFEHLGGAAATVADLLAACPNLSILATSREPLRLQVERVLQVPPLDVTPGGTTTVAAADSDAVRLFAERAATASPRFRLTAGNAPEVAAICARLDGLPLPIELAAAKVKAMTPKALLGILDHALALRSGPRDLPARQRELRSEIAWSHELLDEAERTLFRRIAVFAGGCTLEAAAAVAAFDRAEVAVLEGLTSLAEKSLLVLRDGDGAPRYRMLQVIREYARERLEASGEYELVHERLADWCVRLAERAEPQLHGPDQRRWFDALDAESENIGVVLQWCAARGSRVLGSRLAGALGWYWSRRAHYFEAQHWLGLFHATARDDDPPGPRAKVAFHLGIIDGWVALAIMRNVEARDCFRYSLELWRRIGDLDMTAWTLSSLAGEEFDLGNAGQCALAEEAIRLARTGVDPWIRSFCLAQATMLLGARDPVERSSNLDEAIRLARVVGDPWLLMHALFCRGRFHKNLFEFEAAIGWYREALSIACTIDDRTWASTTLHQLTDCHIGLLEAGPARECLREGVRVCMDSGAKGYLGMFLGSMAGIARVEGRVKKGLRLISAWSALTGAPDERIKSFRGSILLDDTSSDAEIAIGRTLTLEEAFVLGMSED